MSSFFWKVSLYKFLDACKLIGAIFTLLFAQNGLTVFEISLLIAIWSVTQLVLEVPMGVIADKYPRRNVLILGMLLLCIGFALWIKGGFIFYALGLVLWGVKNSLTSGTFEAYVYDELKTLGKEQEYGQVNGRLEGIANLGYMFSAILGGIIAQYNFNLVIILTIIINLIAACVLLTTKSVKPLKSTGEVKYFTILKEAFKEVKTNKAIFFIVMFISLVFGTSGTADEYWPLIFSSQGVNTAFIGTLMALEFGVFALSGYSYAFVERKVKFKNWSLISILISGVLFIIFGLGNSIYLLPLVFLASYLLKLSLVKLDTDLQHKIESDQRATILSIKSLTFEIVYLVTLLFFGYISTLLGVVSLIYIWGAVIIFWTLVLGNKTLSKPISSTIKYT